jgi:hypothetical protein
MKNKVESEKLNECFVNPGVRKVSDLQPPSRVGKPANFFNLREQLSSVHKRMPSKNKMSISFAVDEVKVARNKFAFNQTSVLGGLVSAGNLS